MELPIFEFEFDEDTEGVYAISLVSEPAIDVQMIRFSKDEEVINWKMASEEKHIVVSPVLIPNQKIYRKSIQGEAGYVFASELTIERLSQNFFKQGYNFNSTLEHTTPIEGVYFYQSWLVIDPENDTASAYGFTDLVKGTWFVAMKIENEEVWNEYIKTGKVTGLSMDALLKTRKVETKKIKQEMKKETINEIIKLSIQKVAMAFELNEYILEDGTSIFASSLEVGSIVTDKDGNPLVDFEFTYEDKSYSTDEMGAIKELEVKEEEAPIEEVTVEMAEAPVVDAPIEEAPVETPSEDAVKITELEAKVTELEKKVSELEIEITNLEAKVVSNENEVVSFKNETPSNIGIIDRPLIVENKPKSAIDVIRAALK